MGGMFGRIKRMGNGVAPDSCGELLLVCLNNSIDWQGTEAHTGEKQAQHLIHEIRRAV